MGQVLQLPDRRSSEIVYYGERLQTAGEPWTRREKKLLDRLEFLEAMLLILDDVRLKNINDRDYGMMEIVQEEIPRYIERTAEVRRDLDILRAEYSQSVLAVAPG
jgi:hypothetical protein